VKHFERISVNFIVKSRKLLNNREIFLEDIFARKLEK